MKILSSSRRAFPVLLLCAALLFNGCATTKDARSRNNIANLKTLHLAFIDEFTEAAGKTWDDAKLASRTSAVESQFAAAEQYESTKKSDARRSAAIANLHGRFKKQAAALARKKGFFSATFAADLKRILSLNYDQALKGEDVRS